MKDPERGTSPSSEGASTDKRPDGKKFRRRKGKRKAPPRLASSAVQQFLPDTQGKVAAPAETAPGSPARKRKRRRRRTTPKTLETTALHADLKANASVPALAAGQGNGAAAPQAALPPKKRRSRWKQHGKRGLQGRPLVPKSQNQITSAPLKADAVLATSEQRGAIADARSSFWTHDGAAKRRNDSFAYMAWPHEYYAALDLGTNNCRLLVAQPTRPGQFRVVDAFSRIVRLGEGLAASGRLSNEAMDRATEALRICALKLKTRELRRVRLIATEACRAAENGEIFLSRVLAETGLALEIIDRETEARLAVSGCSSLVERDTRSAVLFDIGGGSSEIAVISIGDQRSSQLADHVTHWTSLPVGVVTLSERYGGRDVTPAVFGAMVTEVEAMLAKFDCPPLKANAANNFHLIGTSGTVTTLAGVHLGLPRYDRRRVDGVWLADADVSAMQAKLLSLDFAGRAANPCIGPDRADLVLAGCAILEAIRRRWPSPRMRVADRGLSEGLLNDMMADDGAWRRAAQRRRHDANEGKRDGQTNHW